MRVCRECGSLAWDRSDRCPACGSTSVARMDGEPSLRSVLLLVCAERPSLLGAPGALRSAVADVCPSILSDGMLMSALQVALPSAGEGEGYVRLALEGGRYPYPEALVDEVAGALSSAALLASDAEAFRRAAAAEARAASAPAEPAPPRGGSANGASSSRRSSGAERALQPDDSGTPDRFRFGRWGGEPIEWRTIARERGRVLAVTVQGIDCRRFDSSSNDWETSELKRWLEGEFERGAFDDAERRRMASRPFCLSAEEAQRYFKDNRDRKCEASELAVKNGAHTFRYGECFWWLRSPGENPYYAVHVDYAGNVYSFGDIVADDTSAVRPAIWLTQQSSGAEAARIEAVAEDIVRTYGSTKTELERLRERKGQLLAEKASGPTLLRQASDAWQSVADLERRLAQLQEKRNGLGVFAFGERRAADSEMASVEERLGSARSAAQRAQAQVRAVRSASAIDADLRECEREIAAEEEAERRSAAAGAGTVHHTEADLTDPRVLAQIRRAHPDESLLLGLLGALDTWQFGRWGGEPIEWRAIARQGKRVLAVTAQGIDCRRFDSSSNVWETSELRGWLEGEFERGAFSDAERRYLASRPFCLSEEEAMQYFEDDEDRKCEASALAVKNGARTSRYGECFWWLRSVPPLYLVYHPDRAPYVRIDGGVNSLGIRVDSDNFAVRPALWLTL